MALFKAMLTVVSISYWRMQSLDQKHFNLLSKTFSWSSRRSRPRYWYSFILFINLSKPGHLVFSMSLFLYLLQKQRKLYQQVAMPFQLMQLQLKEPEQSCLTPQVMTWTTICHRGCNKSIETVDQCTLLHWILVDLVNYSMWLLKNVYLTYFFQ